MSKKDDLSRALDEMTACGKEMIRVAEDFRDILKKMAEPKPTEESPEPPKPAETKTFSFIEVRKAFAAKAHAGCTEQIRALLRRYGADKLSAVKEEDYPKLMNDLEAIS